MWEEGSCIYDTPGIPNNFPDNGTILLIGVSKPITDGTTQCRLAAHSIRNSSRFAAKYQLQQVK